jgi:hypothetical protein
MPCRSICIHALIKPEIISLLVIRQELEEEFEGPRQSSNYALDGVSTASGAVGRVYHKCTSHLRISYIFCREMSKTGDEPSAMRGTTYVVLATPTFRGTSQSCPPARALRSLYGCGGKEVNFSNLSEIAEIDW